MKKVFLQKYLFYNLFGKQQVPQDTSQNNSEMNLLLNLD